MTGRATSTAWPAYSAVNFGHRNPTVCAAAKEQLDRVTLASRAFHSRPAGRRSRRAVPRCRGKDMVLPMNTGAEAVESGIKVARKWGHDVRG